MIHQAAYQNNTEWQDTNKMRHDNVKIWQAQKSTKNDYLESKWGTNWHNNALKNESKYENDPYPE